MTAHNSEFCSIQFANSKTTETHDTPKLNYLRNLKKKQTQNWEVRYRVTVSPLTSVIKSIWGT